MCRAVIFSLHTNGGFTDSCLFGAALPFKTKTVAEAMMTSFVPKPVGSLTLICLCVLYARSNPITVVDRHLTSPPRFGSREQVVLLIAYMTTATAANGYDGDGEWGSDVLGQNCKTAYHKIRDKFLLYLGMAPLLLKIGCLWVICYRHFLRGKLKGPASVVCASPY